MTPRHLVSINDLSRDEIESVFSLADRYLETLGDPKIPFRIGASTNDFAGSVMATLFYEPSTRTRLSFESAMLRLGGRTISSADPASSSAAKGESLADAIRIVSGYADVIVLRHPRDGAARLAAQFASVPVVNGGDGAHEHPTQTLCDLYTLRREKGRIEGLNIAVIGDLRGGRTVHSLVYALARFGANIFTMPAPGMSLPAEVDWRLKNEFGYKALTKTDLPGIEKAGTSAYAPPNSPPSFAENMDALYVTRFQKERSAGSAAHYPKVDSEFLKAPAFAKALLMHPLPRVDELDPALDEDKRAVYFREAAYGVPIRMALVSFLLNSYRDRTLGEFQDSAPPDRPPSLQETDRPCSNANCITRSEPQNARPAFHLVDENSQRLRCVYCDRNLCDS